MYIINKLQFYFLLVAQKKCIFWIICFSQSPVRPLPTITLDDQEYTGL
jgi:hypothetical protein